MKIGKLFVFNLFLFTQAACVYRGYKESTLFKGSEQAETLLNQRQFTKALEIFRQLLRRAQSEKTRNHLKFRIALALKKAGRLEAAITMLEKLAHEAPAAPLAARSIYRAMLWRSGRPGNPEALFLRAELLILKYAHTVYAADALRWLVRKRLEKGDGPGEIIKYLQVLYRRVAGSPVGGNILYAAANLYHTGLKDLESASRLYGKLVRRCPKSGLRDEATMKRARILRALGRFGAAIRVLRRFQRTYQVSWFAGTYHSPYLDDAHYLLGWIYYKDLKQYGLARREFGILLDKFPLSIFRDQAMLMIAYCHHREGKISAARKSARLLLKRTLRRTYRINLKAYIKGAGALPEAKPFQ